MRTLEDIKKDLANGKPLTGTDYVTIHHHLHIWMAKGVQNHFIKKQMHVSRHVRQNAMERFLGMEHVPQRDEP